MSEHEDWGRWELELAPEAARAEDIFFGQNAIRAEQMLKGLTGVLPLNTQIAFGLVGEHVPLSAAELPVSVDGQPIVRDKNEAQGLFAERPDLQATVEGIVSGKTIAERQQWQLNWNRAHQTSDSEQVTVLRAERAALQEQTDSLTFWATVSVLHPVNPAYITEHQPQYMFTSGAAAQTDLCMYLEGELRRLHGFVSKYTPEYIEAWQKFNDTDPNCPPLAPEFMRRQQNNADEAHITMKKIKDVLADMVEGRTHPDGVPNTDTTLQKPVPLREHIPLERLERLRDLPGIDPILAVADGRLHEVPQDGWLVKGELSRYHTGGEVTVTRFTEGGFQARHLNGSKEQGELVLSYELNSLQRGDYAVRYTEIGVDGQEIHRSGLTSTRPQEQQKLSNSFQLRYPEDPLRAASSSLGSSMIWHNLTHTYGSYNATEINRIVADPDQAKVVLEQLALAMGMPSAETASFVDVFVQKEAFGDLLPVSEAERQAQERRNEKVVTTYEDGGQLIQTPGGDLWVKESNGDRWQRYNYSTGVTYLDRDDQMGVYDY